jgi:hypothetical protein
MAVETLTVASAILVDQFGPDIARTWNKECKLLSLVPAPTGVPRGPRAAWAAQLGGATAATVAEGATVAAGDATQMVEDNAYLSWGIYRHTFGFTMTELDVLASTGQRNPVIIGNKLNNRIMEGAATIARAINTDMWTGDGTDGSGNANCVGLLGGAIASSGAYAGITDSTYWISTVLTNGSTARPLTLDLIAQLNQGIRTHAGQANVPKRFICSPGVKTKYEGLFNQKTVVAGMGVAANLGAEDLFWRGRPIDDDIDCSSGYMVAFNPDQCEMQYLPPAPFGDQTLQQVIQARGTADGNVFDPSSIPIKIYPLGRLGSYVQFVMEATVALCLKRRGAFGYIGDIAE